MEVCKSVTPQLIKLRKIDAVEEGSEREVACHLYT
jgi:hypothetical protein